MNARSIEQGSGCFHRRRAAVALFLLIAALVVRIYSAWFYSCSPNPDLGINALMVRHIALGEQFPVFFYGQAYMGTLPAYSGAALYLLMGHSMLPVLITSGLISLLALVFAWLWVKDLYGSRAALYAVLLMLVGSTSFFYYNIFLGYPITLLTGLICCWCVSRIVIEQMSVKKRRLCGWFALLGFAGGIGWWSNNLVASFLAPCALMLLLAVHWKKWLWGSIPALAAFLFGAAPWICFAIKNTDALLLLDRAEVSWRNNAVVYLKLLAGLFDGGSDAQGMGNMAAILVGLAAVAGTLIALKRTAKHSAIWQKRMLGLFPIILLAGNMLACITNSRFAHVPAVRYLLPVFPGIMALAGAALASPKTSAGRWLCRGMIAGILVCQLWLLPRAWHPVYRAGVKEYEEDVEQLAAFCQMQHIDALRADWFSHGLNFRTAEELTVCTYPEYDRYRPYRGEAAVATNVAVLNNFCNLDEFLRRVNAVSEEKRIGRFHLNWGIEFPANNLREIEPWNIVHIANESGEAFKELVDDDLDTPLARGNIDREYPQTTAMVIRTEFSRPMVLAGIVLHGPSGIRQVVEKVACRVDENRLHTIYSREAHDAWFRSGRLFFPGGMLDCEEILFSPVLTKEVWLTVPAMENGTPLISEILFMEKDQTHKTTGRMVPEHFVKWLEDHHAGFVYAPRYLSEWLHENAPQFETIIPPAYYDQYDGFDKHEEQLIRMHKMDENTVMVVPLTTALRTARILKKRGYTYEAEDSGQYRLFYKMRNKTIETPAVNRSLYWTEQGCFLSDETVARLKDAAGHLQKAQEFIKQQKYGAAQFEAKVAVGCWPDLPQAYELLKQAGEEFPIPKGVFVPPEKPLIAFENGVELVGMRWVNTQTERGSSFPVEYVWRCPADVDPQQLAVFVHFEQGNRRFQDDHVLLQTVSSDVLKNQPFPVLFHEKRKIYVPTDLDPGKYTIALGIYNRKSGERLKPYTQLETDHRKVVLNQKVVVTQ